jgi:hypothetical protein
MLRLNHDDLEGLRDRFTYEKREAPYLTLALSSPVRRLTVVFRAFNDRSLTSSSSNAA